MLVRRNRSLPALRTDNGWDRLFDELFHELPIATTFFNESRPYPAVNTWEDEKSFRVEAEIPGLKEKDLEISVLGNELRIAGGHEEEKEEKDARYHRRERFTGKFSRVFRFPVDIDEDKVSAKFDRGILTITLPKATAALPRRIEVKS